MPDTLIRSRRRPALLVLADGTNWPGLALGALGDRTGEIVFNTSMTGYQEVLTDPSYHGQMVMMTSRISATMARRTWTTSSPHAWLAGFVVRAASPLASNWRATDTLDGYLARRERGGHDGSRDAGADSPYSRAWRAKCGAVQRRSRSGPAVGRGARRARHELGWTWCRA